MSGLRLFSLVFYLKKAPTTLMKSNIKMILIKFNHSSPIVSVEAKNNFLKHIKKDRKLGNMEPIVKKFDILWINSFEKKHENNQNLILITNRIRILEDDATEMEQFLWEQFISTQNNIYQLHLNLIEYYQSIKVINSDACIIFLNRTFEAWWKQQINRIKRGVSKNSCNLIENRSNSSFLSLIEPELVEKAFDLAIKKIYLLNSLNKIYKFEENFQILKPKIDNFLDNNFTINRIKLVNELKLNDLYIIDYEKALVPLLIQDKYSVIEEMVSSNEKTLYAFVGVCNNLCNGNTNFKKVAESFKMKKCHNFSGSKIAKYAVNCLRKVKKTNLVNTMYPGIIFQLKLNQLRFLINNRYNQSDLISFEGWTELLTNLVEDNENLIYQLFLEIINYHQDVLVGFYFTKIYGEKFISQLPESAKALYKNNIDLIQSDYENKILQLKNPNRNKFYWPKNLKFNDIQLIYNKENFIEMLDYFENNQPEVIGLDCEWKPAFGTEDLIEDENLREKNLRPDTFQIATRQKVFIVDSRDLVDLLDENDIDRFGNLILFSENMLKLGYDFDQDSKKLFHSFSKFKHVFFEFSESVININQIIMDLEKRCALFENSGKALKTKGLSKLTESCFGKPLDKSECMSNWQNRPLRQNQIRYASLDAFILIEIHDFIQQRIKELNIEYDYINRSSFL